MRPSHFIRRIRFCLQNTFGYPKHAYARISPQTSNNNSSPQINCSYSCYFWRFDVPIYCGIPLTICTMYLELSLAFGLSVLLLAAAFIMCLQWFEFSLVYATDEPPKSRILLADPFSCGFDTWKKVRLFPDGKNGPIVTGFLLLQSDLVERSHSPTILILHGNAGNAGHRLPMCQLLKENVHCNILIIDYRGYGRSTGYPTEQGLYRDAIAALDYLISRQDIDQKSIFVFGRSLGGAVAVHLGTDSETAPRICGIIVENSFTSLPDLAQYLFQPTFGFLTRCVIPRWIFMNRFNSVSRFSDSQCPQQIPPFLFVSGDSDTIIPPSMMQELASSYVNIHNRVRTGVSTELQSGAPHCSRTNAHQPILFATNGIDGLVCFPNGKHNDTWLCEFWCDVLMRFIQQASLNPPMCNPTDQIV